MTAIGATDLAAKRLHVVSGKGGTGKTTVAAALALVLAQDGRRTLLCEVEGRQGIAQLFDVPQLPYAETRIATARGGGELWALAIEPKAALLEYLELFYRLGRAGRVLERLGAIDFATTIAPGLRDVLLSGKVYEAVRRNEHGRPAYDAVVLDAPPTGRIGGFLNVNEQIVDLAKVGPIKGQANSIMTLLRSETTAVHLVTLLEEMPVQETQDALAELRDIRLPLGAVVVNQVRRPMLADADLSRAASGRLTLAEVTAGLQAAGLGGGRSTPATALRGYARALVTEGREHSLRIAQEREQREQIDGLGLPIAELPALAGGIDLGALYELGAELREQLLEVTT